MRVLASAACLLLLTAGPRAQEVPAPVAPPIALLLSRVASYVERFADRVSGMVVEESYVQDVRQLTRFGYRQNLLRGPSHRTLRSDLLLVRPSGFDGWMQFRDVFEVDGKSVRDRSDRLEKLFLTPPKNATQQTERIIKESARYNIGDIERTINLPLLGLTILSRDVQSSFQFRIADKPTGDGGMWEPPKLPAFAPPPGTVIVAFTEIGIQAIVKKPDGTNLRSHGRFWIVPETGEVRMTELRVEDWTLGAAVHVAYDRPAGIDTPIPVAMHEMYENHTNKQQIEGLATYSNFREFSVKVDEQIAPVR